MVAPVPCVLVKPTERAEVWLRRYNQGNCPRTGSYHDSRTPLGQMPCRLQENDTYFQPMMEPPDADPRWPAMCECGFVFLPADPRQVFYEPVYRAPDGKESTLPAASPGWMWHAPWLPWKGTDGLSLVVKLPSREDWQIDGRSSNGGSWSRTGDAPRITVTPSISTPRFHGLLRDGLITPV